MALSTGHCASKAGSAITVFDLLVHPSHQSQLELSLVNFLLFDLIGRRDPVVTEHPDDDETARALFQHHHFRAERTLVHMLWPGQEEAFR
jgi:hypothetical protein